MVNLREDRGKDYDSGYSIDAFEDTNIAFYPQEDCVKDCTTSLLSPALTGFFRCAGKKAVPRKTREVILGTATADCLGFATVKV
jgi:hypothetical protein